MEKSRRHESTVRKLCGRPRGRWQNRHHMSAAWPCAHSLISHRFLCRRHSTNPLTTLFKMGTPASSPCPLSLFYFFHSTYYITYPFIHSFIQSLIHSFYCNRIHALRGIGFLSDLFNTVSLQYQDYHLAYNRYSVNIAEWKSKWVWETFERCKPYLRKGINTAIFS